MTDRAAHADEELHFAAVDRPPSLADHVRRVLREDIFAGRFAPGERLTEAMVMERTRVSRTPAREGMQLLQADGLLNFERRRGTYIAEELSPREALMIYECRLVIEPYMTGRAAEMMTTAEVARVGAICDRFASAVEGDQQGVGLSRIDAELHGEIYEASGSDLIAVFRSYWSRLEFQLSTRVYSRGNPRQFVAEHLAILEALRARDAEAASSRMAEHIAQGRRVLEKTFEAREAKR